MKLAFTNIGEEQKNLLPEAVYQFIRKFDQEQAIKVAEIDPRFANGELLSREYNIPYEIEVNCLVVEGKQGDDKVYAALLVPCGKRANTNARVKKLLGTSKISFADLDYVIQESQMEFGSITPVGLPASWSILIDASLMEQEQLIVGGGLVQSKLMLPSSLLKALPNSQVVQGLAKD